MIPGVDVIIVAWVHEEGDVQPTGRMVMRDGCLQREFRRGPMPLACVWSRDPADLPGAKAYAAKQDALLLVLRDTDDVLDRARATVMRERSRTAQPQQGTR